jgi:hypothetical protein
LQNGSGDGLKYSTGRRNVHLDLNPWWWLESSTDILTGKETLTYEDPQDFIRENNMVVRNMGRHVQCVMNFKDNIEDDGGTIIVPKFHHHVAQWCASHLTLKQKLPWLTFPDIKSSGSGDSSIGSNESKFGSSNSSFGCNRSSSGVDSNGIADTDNTNIRNNNNNNDTDNHGNNNNHDGILASHDNDNNHRIRNDNTVNIDNNHNEMTINPHCIHNKSSDSTNNNETSSKNNEISSLMPDTNKKNEIVYKQENNRKNSNQKLKKKGVKNRDKLVEKVVICVYSFAFIPLWLVCMKYGILSRFVCNLF